MRIPFLSDPSVYAEDHSERVFSCPEADLRIDFWSVKSDGKKVTQKVTKPGKVKGLSVKSTSKRKMFVKFAKIKNVKGYQISYSTNKTFKKAKKVTVSSNSKTIKKLKSKKMYYVRVRAIRKNKQKTLYGAWSAKKKVKIK